MKLGILASHPIQYQAPLFRTLAGMTDLTVFFAHQQSGAGQAEAGYGVAFDWDVDLFSGYHHVMLDNVAQRPGTGHFSGCDTPGIAAALAQAQIDVLLVMGWNLKSYWQAVLACRRQGIPVLVRGDSQLVTSRSLLRRTMKQLLYPFMLRQFDGMLYVGQRNKEYLMYYGAREDRLHFAPHCVENDRFRAQANLARQSGARAALGIGDDEQAVLFVGRMVSGKRPQDVLCAMALLQQRDPARRLVAVMAGDGDERPALAALAVELGVRAIWPGFCNQSRMPALYAAADVLVLPSNGSETWGLVVNEAMASGTRCVVSSACGCSPDMIVPGHTGEVFASGDVAACADALARVLDTPPDPAALWAHAEAHAPVVTATGILQAARLTGVNGGRP